MTTLLQADGLIKRYHGQQIVDSISFHVEQGECFGLLGPNGAGKTTTLRMVMGLTPVDGGSLTIFGLPMHSGQREISERLGVVPQEESLDIELTVSENLMVYGGYFGLSKSIISERVQRLITFAQLERQADHSVRDLSGGMRQRLAIARSLMAEPELLVLDEPTTGLDPQARHLIWHRLRSLKKSGMTLLLTTHYMEEAARLCDRLLVMDHGRILDIGPPESLIRRHVEPEVIEIQRYEETLPLQLNHADLSCRMESVGDTLYCYTEHSQPLLTMLQQRHDAIVLHRPANLEDVFLKITGRALRD